MSYRLFLGSNEVTWGGSPATPSTATTWIRPSDWLTFPDTSSVTGSTGAFFGILAVYTGSNFVSLGSNSPIIVDWGDGVIESYAAQVNATHSHNYNILSASSYSSGSNGFGSGSAIGYRQAMVKVIPSGSGNSLINIDLQKKHPRASLPSIPSVPWLDIAVGGTKMVALAVGGGVVEPSNVERVNWASLTGSADAFSYMFQNCHALQSVPLFDTSKGTAFVSMFQSCYSLRTVPLFSLSTGSNFNSMFANCNQLTTIPPFNLSKGTDFTTMFSYCSALTSLPLFTFSSSANYSQMFTNCKSLASIPPFNLSGGGNFFGMFYACDSIRSVPLFDLSKGTGFALMFSLCLSLQSVPLFNLTSGSTYNQMFNGCASLIEVPPMPVNTAESTIFSSVFGTCANLRRGALSGSGATISYANCSLARNELVEIFNNLSITGSTPCTITVTGNHGVVDLTAADTASVIAKGWSYVG